MADVTERGQLIVLTGLVLAIVFVVLALLLNTVIFTENLASRGTDLGGRDAVEFQRTVDAGVGELVDAENDEEYQTNASVRSNVSDGVAEFERLLQQQYAGRSVVTEATLVTMHNGALIRQTDGSRNLSANNGDADWTPALEISDTRGFVVNVTGGLNSTTVPDDGFKVVLDESGGGAQWQVSIYHNDSASATELAVMNGSEGTWTKGVCSPAAAPEVDLTRGTVDGSDCDALRFAKGVSPPYDIRFDDGDLAEGTYNLTVNVSGAGRVETAYLNGPGSADSPYFSRAVYSAVVDLYLETTDLVYEVEVRIARGEPA